MQTLTALPVCACPLVGRPHQSVRIRQQTLGSPNALTRRPALVRRATHRYSNTVASATAAATAAGGLPQTYG